MRSVDPRAAEILRTLAEFDESVNAAEPALAERHWPELEALLATQHRLTHALTNLLEGTRNERPQAFTNEVNRRLASISERREDQLRRLIAFNHLVKERLTIISRSREMRRVNVDERAAPRILDLLQ